MRTSGDTSEMTARRPDDGVGRRPTTRVLVAEDERDVAELIRYTLAREGFENKARHREIRSGGDASCVARAQKIPAAVTR